MISKLIGAAIVCAALTAGGCMIHPNAETNSGPQTTKEFHQTGFDHISAHGSMDVTVTVGGAESIKVEGNQDRIDNLKMEVVDGELLIKEESTSWFGSNGKVHITITLPKLTGYEVNGSGDAKIEGVEADTFSVAINGSGDITATGTATNCSVSVNGSGDVDLSKVKAKSATVQISGSGDVEVDASDTLSASIAGSGDVTYSGAPKVTKQVAGSGSITAATK